MNDIYTIIVLSLAIIVFLIKFMNLQKEYFSKYFFCGREIGDWNLHFDEKITLTDARFLYIKYVLKQQDVDKFDFLPPPVSACFGILPTVLVYVGFILFGYNNFGLRFFYVLISCLSNILVVLIIMNLLPSLIGLLLCCLYLLNWNLYILQRHAIIENILTFYFLSIYFVFMFFTDWYFSNIFIISLIASSVILFKINFSLYVAMFLFSIVIPTLDLSLITKSLSGFFLGLVFFETLQAIILNKFGVLKWRYIALIEAFRIHSGRKHYFGQTLRPFGYKIIYVIINLFFQWFGFRKNIIDIKENMRFVNCIAVLCIIAIIVFSYKYSSQLFVLLTFVSIFISGLLPFFFYLKRIIALFPLFFIIIAYLLYSFFLVCPQVNTYILVLICAVSIVIIYKQQRINGYMKASNNLERFSKEIEGLCKERVNIFCHGIAYRNLWRVTKHRLFSADDDLMTNIHIIDWAIKKNERYVIITTGGKFISKNRLNLLRIINCYVSDSSDTEVPEEFVVCEINI